MKLEIQEKNYLHKKLERLQKIGKAQMKTCTV